MPVETGQHAAPTGWQGWVTSPTDPARRLLLVRPVTSAPTATIVFDPSRVGQTWRGVGASLTDSSVRLLEGNDIATDLLFSPTRTDGAQLNWVRLPLSSTDFSTRSWSWTRTGPVPAESVAAVRYLTDEVLPRRRNISVVATAWSAPASMKQPVTLRGGALRTSSEAAYGDLLVRQGTWLRAQDLPLRAMTLGNEPDYETDYTSMKMSAAQQVRLAKGVSARLASQSIQLWAVDHNWIHRQDVYDPVVAGAPKIFAAAAVHCYGGTPGQMAGLKIRSILTECTGTNDTWSRTFRWDMVNLVTKAIEAGSTGLMMWNLALDASHGPVDPLSVAGCKNCRGLLTIDGGRVSPEPEFFTLAHLSRAARPGAKVIASTSQGPVLASAFRNADGSIGIVGHNQSSHDEIVEFRVRGRSGVRFQVRAGEMFTLTGNSADPVTSLRSAVVNSTTGSLLFIDDAGFRHPITDSAIAACLPTPTRTVSNLAPYPLGENAGCPLTEDSVYSSPDGASYLVTGFPNRPRRRWMPTAESYFCAVNAGYPIVRGPTYVVRDLLVGEDMPEKC